MIQVTIHAHGAAQKIYVLDNGIRIGAAGELYLTSSRREEDGVPTDMKIYAPGVWSRLDVEEVND